MQSVQQPIPVSRYQVSTGDRGQVVRSGKDKAVCLHPVPCNLHGHEKREESFSTDGKEAVRGNHRKPAVPVLLQRIPGSHRKGRHQTAERAANPHLPPHVRQSFYYERWAHTHSAESPGAFRPKVNDEIRAYGPRLLARSPW